MTASRRLRLRFATYLAPSLEPMYRWVAQQCGATDFVVGKDWRELATGAIDAAFVCSPPLHWLKGAVGALAAPVLSDPDFDGRPLYSSEVVVRAGSPHRGLAHLRGARWAFNEPGSWSGYWVTLDRVGSWAYFGEVVPAGSHQRSLEMVAGGVVDGAAIDCQVLRLALAAEPSLAGRIQVTERLGPWPIQPVVARAGLEATRKRQLSELLLGLRSLQLERFGVKGFAPPPDYGEIARRIPAEPPSRSL